MRSGRARCGAVRFGRYGKARYGRAECGMASYGRLGTVRFGRLGWVRRVVAGKVRHGDVR